MSFSRQEDTLLTQAWLVTSMDVVHIKGQPKTTYWGRVAQNFHNYKTFASDREEKSLQQRWSTIQISTSKFCEYVTQVENKYKAGLNEQDKFFYAKQLYEKLETKKFHFDHCWKLLRHAPKWVDDMHKKKLSNGGKGTSFSPEFSSPSTSEIVEDDVPSTELGNKERSAIRKDVPSADFRNMERPIRTDILNIDFGNTKRSPTRKDAPNTDFGNIDRQPIRTDVLETDVGNMDRQRLRTKVLNTGFGSMETPPIRKDAPNTDLVSMERTPIRTEAVRTDFVDRERSPIRKDVPNTDFENMDRPRIRKAEKLKIKDHQKSDNANKQVVDLLHVLEKWRDQVNEEKRQYRLQKIEMLRERLETDKERLEMDKERLRLDREDKEERIMLMDISGMPHELHQYYHRRRREILARGMGGA